MKTGHFFLCKYKLKYSGSNPMKEIKSLKETKLILKIVIGVTSV